MLIVLLIGRIFEKVMRLWKEMKLWGRLYVPLIRIKKQNSRGSNTLVQFLDVLNLLFQNPGQFGPEMCPGRTKCFYILCSWRRLDSCYFPSITTIVHNLGDMLIHLSSNRFKSAFHQVRPPHECACGERHSFACFNQPSRGTRIID